MALIFAAGEMITKDLISSIIKKSAGNYLNHSIAHSLLILIFFRHKGVINHPIVLPDTQVSVDQSIKDFKR